MPNPVRLAAILAAAIVLLAAGKAPNGDLDFLNEIAPAPVEAQIAPIFDDGASAPQIAEPDLGPVMPEAGTLTQLVQEVRGTEPQTLDPELKCLASAVYYESKGEPLDGQLAVAQVILNRVENGRFGRDVCAVVTAPKQFSFVSGGQIRTPAGSANWEIAKAVAMIAIGGGWREIVPDATHFHATRVNPGWKLRRVATVGQHVFYR